MQTPGTYGIMQYPLTSIQSQPGYTSMVSTVNQGNGMRGVTSAVPPGASPRNFPAVQSGGYVGSPYHGVPGLQYPVTYPGMMNHQPLVHPHSPIQPTVLSNDSAVHSSVSGSNGSQIEGEKILKR